MKISLLEKPSIYTRNNESVVIFPSKPYWFSATSEIKSIMKSLELVNKIDIVNSISLTLEVNIAESEEIFSEISAMLYSSGVASIDGNVSDITEHSPEFQINEVENVLVIAATQQCNLTCSMCYASANKKMRNEMTTSEIKGIIDQLSEMPWEKKISRVALTGGEIFLRDDAMELIEYIHKLGFFAQVNTNATILTADQIKRLSRLKNLKISISLDGSNKISHEFIRGENTFYHTVKNIKMLCDYGVSVGINMFVHDENIYEIEETLKLADSLGVDNFNCLNMMNVGRGNTTRTKKNLKGVPLSKFYRQVFNSIRKNDRFQHLMSGSTFANQIMGIAGGVKSYGCGIGTNRAIYVKADGSLYPCADTAVPHFRLGNLRTDNLFYIWQNSDKLTELRSLNIDTMNEKCGSCDVRYICAGNCRGENYQTTKDINSPHFKCVEIHDSILELMWILTEEPDLFKCKVDELHNVIDRHVASA